MADEEKNNNRVVIDRIIRVLTERPGDVVYRDQIAESLNMDEQQISGAIQRFKAKSNSDIAGDIQVVVTARAWRYVPNVKASRALRTKTENVKTPPLTVSIRTYFLSNPQRVVYINELRDAMSTTDVPLDERKVYVGINNAKLTSDDFKRGLRTVVAGRAWQYVPINDGDEHATSEPALPESPPVATTLATQDPTSVHSSNANNEVLLLEKIADLPNGDQLVRDENNNIFRMTRI